MLNPKHKLAELVRILEERDYIFPADPAQVTESLCHVDGQPEGKILRRSEMIDRNHQLQDVLEYTKNAAFWLWIVGVSLMFAGGFSGTYILMDKQDLNFFLILAGVLGMNTVMLLVWLVSVAFHFKFGNIISHPMTWMRGKDPVNQALLRLYTEEWKWPSTRWLIGRTSHSLWLATLLGMLVSVLMLLLVRQYTFNWESTLLTNAASVKAIEWLGWLPSKVGFPVPDADAVLQGRLNSNTDDARAWSGLLVGSIVCYGILPRFTAWAACKIMLKISRTPLPLDKPYYQKIIQQWQTKIIDADTQSETVATVPPKISISDGPKWAVMLEMQWPDDSWFIHTLGQDWLDKGVAESRDTVHTLVNELQQQSAQLLIGVRAHTMPDRGALRQITSLAEAAKGGAVVQLLVENQVSDGMAAVLRYWQEALAERNIAWLNPPQWAQTQRMQREAV
ncbi:DUF2868 domain-containing protein [Neisseria iguanae]|uniref:DUF2868 domain-containing protein n=1 Tax=Neisseria iguanae TaxID=90242 RepID=A0A2P7U290_9NEIS|nr:DUF2868 domain-containing protein [Neisseria iguanae]PSJ81094.1 DUF2868 domain-containing protein [Neisseria iguanae]